MPVTRTKQWAGIALAVLLLASCGGGEEAVDTDPGARLARARMGEVDPALCEGTDNAYVLSGGRCVGRFVVQGPLAAAKPPPSRPPQRLVATLTPDDLFAWAATHYPSYFGGEYVTNSTTVSGFGEVYYRYWPGLQNYLGVADGEVYAFGQVTGGQILHVGSMTSLACVVYDCSGGGSTVLAGEALAVGSTVNGATTTEGTSVVHQVYLLAGTTYRFDLTSAAADPKLWLYSGTTLIDENDDISYPTDTNSRIYFTPDATGTYSLKAGFFEGFGAYALSGAISTGGDGGVNWNSPFTATEIVSTTQTLATNTRWGQAFTVSDGSLPVEVIFAAQYKANLYVTTGATLAACASGGSFTQLTQYTFSGVSGYKSFTLPPGSYGICIRNTATTANTVRVEFQQQPSVTGFHFSQNRFAPVVRTVPAGGRVVQAATSGDNYRLIVDGANTGGTFWYIPATEQAAFLAGETFLYYDGAFNCSTGTDAPGLCELTGIGEYMIAYHNNTALPQTIVITGRDYVPD